MKIVIPGGSGQVGTLLARAFLAEGHEIVVLSRRPSPAPWVVAPWDARTLGPWAEHFEGADVAINLAGRSVNCRYNARNRRAILDSRVESTRIVGLAIAQTSQPPRAWLQASTATIYAHRFDAPNDEATGLIGGPEPGFSHHRQFSVEVAQAWERAVEEAETPVTRKVILRSSMVMSPDPGGIFDVLLSLVRLGLGGRSGDGRQYVSWIHDTDFIEAIRWIINHDSLSGPVNLASPEPIPNSQFMQELRRAWGTPIGLPATRWMLALGTFLMRTEAELVLKSRRVVPGRLVQEGFSFRFPSWNDAARDLCRRWRSSRGR